MSSHVRTKTLILLLTGVSGFGQLAAQSNASDSTGSLRQRYESAMVVMRDSVANVSVAASRFRRDLGSAARETVLSRAGSLRLRCEGAMSVLERRRSVFDPREVPLNIRSRVDTLTRAIHRLETDLQRECIEGLPAEGPRSHVDSLRAWGPYQIRQIEDAIRKYIGASQSFAHAADLEISPRVR